MLFETIQLAEKLPDTAIFMQIFLLKNNPSPITPFI